MKIRSLILAIFALIFTAKGVASPCAAPSALANVAVPDHPFAAVATADNCWLFVSMDAGKGHGGIAVLHNQGGNFGLDHVLALQGAGNGESLSHDGRILAVSAGDDTTVLDVARLEHAAADPLLGMFHSGKDAGAVYTAISLDDKWLFVSDEGAQRISVFDLAKARSEGFSAAAPIGRVPMAIAPVGLALSPDGRWLYATSQVALPSLHLPAACNPENRNERMHPAGLIFRIDVGKAVIDPSHAVLAALPAGCNPVRVAVSPSGGQLWVTARGDNSLLRYQIDA